MTPRKKTARKKTSSPRVKKKITKKKTTRKKAAKKKTAARKPPKKKAPGKRTASRAGKKAPRGVIREKATPARVIRSVRYTGSPAKGGDRPVHPQEYLPLPKGFVKQWQQITSQAEEGRALPLDPRELFLKIRLRAYYLYLDRGAGHGDDWADWFRAEKEVLDPLELENAGLN